MINMKIFFLRILCTFFLTFLLGCETVSKKIEDTTAKEEAKLNKLLNGTEMSLKKEMGKPDRISFKEGSRNRFYIYESKRYKIKCERVFEINSSQTVVGYTSKNCF